MDCVFCTDVSGSGEVVFEDADAWVVLHPDRAVIGHVMIVSRSHVENVVGLDPAAWLRLAALWQRTEQALLETTGAARIIVLKLGLQTPHLHLHLYPVSATTTRGEVFAAFTGETQGEDPGLADRLRLTLSRQ